MPEYFCSCGFWVTGIGEFGEHLGAHRDHYRVNRTKWKKIVEGSGSRSNPPGD